MKYNLMGRSGLRVSELCLGTMTFGEEWGWGSSREESKRVFDAFAKAGGNFFDTANRYTEGTSERLLGEFIKEERKHFVISTKYTLCMHKRDPNSCGNHKKNMILSLEASLERLKTDYVDIFWLHAWDFTTNADEIMRGLEDLVRSGKVLYLGISNTPAWVVARANTLAQMRGWSPFVAMQIEYNLTERSGERDLLPMARSLDIGICPWGVLAAGVLSGKYSKNSEPEKGMRLEGQPKNKAHMKIAEVVIKIAEEIGCSPSHVAIKWLQSKPMVTSLIIGARTRKQLLENIDCLDVTLEQSQLDVLDEASAIELGYPHDFLKKDVVREMIYGPHLHQEEFFRC